jgi:flavin reductase (DIM6/NTAB) family NADH-FMN oxidoreductase RutF
MKFLVTARAETEVFGRKQEKEDMVLAECSRENEKTVCIMNDNEFASRLIKTSKVFAMNVIKESKKELAEKCEMLEGEFIDKFKELGFEKGECTSIDCPCIANTDVIECSVIEETRRGETIAFIAKEWKESRYPQNNTKS